MGDSLNILIQAQLAKTQTKKNLRDTLKEIAQELKPIKIAVDFDKSVLKTLNSFVKAMEQVKQAEKEQQRVVEETIRIFKESDGVVRKTITQRLANNHIINRTIETLDAERMALKKNQQQMESSAKTAQALANTYSHTEGTIRRSILLNPDGTRRGVQTAYRIKNAGSLVVNENAKGRVTSARYNANPEQEIAQNDRLRNSREKLLRQLEELRSAQLSNGSSVLASGAYDDMEKQINAMTRLREMANVKSNFDTLKYDHNMVSGYDKEALDIKKATEELQRYIAFEKEKLAIDAKELNRRYSKLYTKDDMSTFNNTVSTKLDGVDNIKDARNAIADLHQGLRKTRSELAESGSHVKSFGEQLKIAFERIPIWFVGMGAFYGTLHWFQDGVTFVNDLNRAMTEVSIVTGKSQQSVMELGKEYQKTAYDMGVTTAEFSKGAVEFYRQGLSDADVMDRLRTTTQYAKISNLDFKQSAEILTATTNSMNVSIEHASDIFSYLGDATASGSDEIGKAFQRVGGSAGALGISFEKVSSWIATVSSKTRESGETIGNSIKSILARVQNLKEKGFDEQDGTKINDVAKSLNSVGVALTDETGNFRDFGNVMDDLGKNWQNLSSKQKAYVSTTVAGSYQQARFLNLMEGYDQSVTLYDKSLNQAGTTQQKYNLYLEGTQAHLDRLKNASEAVWMNSFQSKGIQNVVDALTSLVNMFGKVIEYGGIMLPIAGAITTLWLTMSKTGRGMVTMLADWVTQLRTTNTATIGFTASTTASTASINTMNMAMIRARVSAIALQSALGLGLGAVLTGLGMLLGSVIGKMVEANAEQDKLRQDAEKMAETYSKNGTQIDKLVSKYDELKSNGVSDSNAELLDTQNQLAKLMPNMVESIDEQGNARLRNVEAIKSELEYSKQLKAQLDDKKIADFQDKVKTAKEKIKKLNDEAYRLTKPNDFVGYGDNGEKIVVQESAKDKTEREIKYTMKLREMNGEQQKINDSTKEYVRLLLEKEGVYQNLSDVAKKYVDNLVVQNKEQVIAKGLDYAKTLADQAKIVAQVDERLKNEFAKGNPPKTKEELDQLRASLVATGIPLDALGQLWDKYVNKIQSANEKTADMKSTVDDLQNTYFDTMDKMQGVNEAIDKLNSGHKLSYSEIKKLIKEHDVLADSVTVENGQLSLNVDALLEVRKAEVASLDVAINTAKEKVKAVEQSVGAILQQYGLQLEGLLTLADVEQRTTELMKKMKAERDAMNGNGPVDGIDYNAIGKGDMTDNIEQKTLQAKNDMSELIKARQKLQNLTKLQSTGGNWDTTSDNLASAKSSTDAYSKSLSDLDLALQKIQNRLKKYPKSSDEYKNAIKEEIALTKQQIALADKVIANGGGDVSGGVVSVSPVGGGKATGAYADTINSYANQYGIDPQLVRAVAMQESSLGQTSSNVMQVNGMDGASPEESIRVGVQMLANLLKQTNGDIEKALAGYNMGAGILGYFNSHGGYSQANMQNFSDQQKNLYGYSGYGDVNYVDNVKRYYNGSPSATSSGGGSGGSNSDRLDRAKKDKLSKEDALFSLETELLNADLAKYEEQLAQLDNRMKISEVVMSKMATTSGDYRSELELQVGLLQEKQKAVASEADAIRNSGMNTDEFNSKLKQLSQSWWDFQRSIDDKTFELLNSKLGEINAGIENLDYWLNYSKTKMALLTQGTVAYNDELIFQINLLKDKQHEARREMDLIQEQLALGKLTQQQQDELNKKLKELSKSWLDYAEAINSLNQDTANGVIEFFKTVYETQKRIALDALDKESTAFEELHKQKMDSLDKELKKYEDVINAKLKSLEIEQDEDQFQRQLQEKQKQQKDITSKLDLLKMDNSMEAKAKRKDLMTQLEQVNTEIEHMQTDRERDLRKKSLQDQLEQKRTEVELEKDTATMILDGKQVTYEEGKKLLEQQKKDIESHYEDLLNDEREFNRIKQEIMNGNVEEAKKKLGEFATWITGNTEAIGKSITNNMLDKITEFGDRLSGMNNLNLDKLKGKLEDISRLIEQMKKNSGDYFGSTPDKQGDLHQGNNDIAEKLRAMGMNVNYDASSGAYTLPDGTELYKASQADIERNLVISQMQRNSAEWHGATDARKKQLEDTNRQLGAKIGAIYDEGTGRWTFPQHHKGGTVGEESPTGLTGMVNDLFNKKPNERIIKALEGELMAPADNITKNFMPNMKGLAKSIASANNTPVVSGDNTTNINITIDKVMGDENGANLVAKRIVDSFKKLGGKI